MVQISSTELSERVNSRLLEDDQLAVYALKARVDEDGKVLVQGIVDVLAEKHQAEEYYGAILNCQRDRRAPGWGEIC